MRRDSRRALISVYDKCELENLLSCLKKYDYDLIASGKTAKRIEELGFKVTAVADITGFPESPNGLLKTLHPKIHGGFLLDPNKEDQRLYMEKHLIPSIDLLVSNLYPFQDVVKRKHTTLLEAAENIDIGGPTLIRSAAKAALIRGDVLVITSPTQYQRVVDSMNKNRGSIEPRLALNLASAAFQLTQKYDAAIHRYLSRRDDS